MMRSLMGAARQKNDGFKNSLNTARPSHSEGVIGQFAGREADKLNEKIPGFDSFVGRLLIGKLKGLFAREHIDGKLFSHVLVRLLSSVKAFDESYVNGESGQLVPILDQVSLSEQLSTLNAAQEKHVKSVVAQIEDHFEKPLMAFLTKEKVKGLALDFFQKAEQHGFSSGDVMKIAELIWKDVMWLVRA